MGLPVAILNPGPVERAEEDVRSTVVVFHDAAPNAVNAPPVPDLMETNPIIDRGLNTSYDASPIIPPEYPLALDRYTYADTVQHVINDGQSRKGYAAAQEDAGNWGHGTLAVIFGIEPILNVGRDFGPTYFETMPVSVPASQVLAPVGFQDQADAVAAAAAMSRSRQATAQAPYAALMGV